MLFIEWFKKSCNKKMVKCAFCHFYYFPQCSNGVLMCNEKSSKQSLNVQGLN